MLLCSYTFLFLFLPALLLCYFGLYRLGAGVRNGVLLLFSLAFYAAARPVYLALLCASILINYGCGLWIGARRDAKKPAGWATACAVGLNVLLLGYFKYADYAVGLVNAATGLGLPLPNVVLPVGVSFYTFQGLSYVLDVRRGACRAQRNPLHIALYIALFPKLAMGPLARYQTLEGELTDRAVTAEGFAQGLCRFVCGLGKKMLLANVFGQMADALFAEAAPNAGMVWVGALAYAMQIYFDFSGYSDMAIGLGRLFGFTFPENFRYPYTAATVTDFWRRWHITLSTWFRDYVYIPLGGNRRGPWRQAFNLLAVWALTGLWHGAGSTFVAWGLYYGVLLILEKFVWGGLLRRLPKAVGHAYTLLCVLVGWVIFRAPSLPDAWMRLGAMFRPAFSFEDAQVWARYLFNYRAAWIAAVVGCTPLLCSLWGKIKARWASPRVRAWQEAAQYAATLALFALCVVYLYAQTYNPFIYFQF